MEKNIKARKRGFSVLSLLILLLLLLYVVSLLVTLGWALMTSLKGKLDYIDNPFGLPKKWLFSNYKTAAEYYASQIIDKNGPRMVQIGEMLVNSLLFAVGSSFLGTLVTCVMAYASSRFDFKCGKLIYGIVIVTMVLPIVGSLPSEIQITKALGIYDSMIGMWILKSGFLGMHFLIFYGMFKAMPKDYSEAAYVDGANNFTVMVRIMFPLARNTFLTIMLIKFIDLWNDYYMTMQFMPNIKTLAFGLYEYSQSYKPAISSTPMKLAGCCILAVPVLVLFLCFHDRIMGNISMGGIKE